MPSKIINRKGVCFAMIGIWKLIITRYGMTTIFLNSKTLTSTAAVKNHLYQFFVSKNQKFYERAIIQL